MTKLLQDQRLFLWCLEQASDRYKGNLTQEQIDKLNKINFPWELYENELDTMGYNWKKNNPNGKRWKDMTEAERTAPVPEPENLPEFTESERIENLEILIQDHEELIDELKTDIEAHCTTISELKEEIEDLGEVICTIVREIEELRVSK